MPDSKQMFGKSSGDTPDILIYFYLITSHISIEENKHTVHEYFSYYNHQVEETGSSFFGSKKSNVSLCGQKR